jgi:hypothetical protein
VIRAADDRTRTRGENGRGGGSGELVGVPAAATGDSCENDRERSDGDELSHISTYTPPLAVPSRHYGRVERTTFTTASRRAPPAVAVIRQQPREGK